MSYWLQQVGRAASRMLNALCGGEGDCTFSAWSYELVTRGSRWGVIRVAFVDSLPFNYQGHCEAAWRWHMAHDLIALDTPDTVQ